MPPSNPGTASAQRKTLAGPFSRGLMSTPTRLPIGGDPIFFGLHYLDPAGLAFVAALLCLPVTPAVVARLQWREMWRQTHLL